MALSFVRSLYGSLPSFSFFRRQHSVSIALSEHGPAVDVHTKLLGFTWRSSESTFARVVASRYDDIVAQAAKLAPPPVLAGGAVNAPALRRFSAPARLSMPRYTTPVRSPAQPQRLSVAPHQVAPNPAWAARCDAMANDAEWADTPEVQSTATLLDITLRVFTPAQNGSYQLQFVANRDAQGPQIDLVLADNHYRWIDGGVGDSRFDDKSEVNERIMNVPGDGNCFFHSVVRSLAPMEMTHDGLRAAVVDGLRHQADEHLHGSDLTLSSVFS